jgi:8-oxo-dGTP pyrophosphatase MutT (NUDIX family)
MNHFNQDLNFAADTPPRTERAPGPSVSCVFICHDGNGRFVLARRGSSARDEPGTWDTGAGGIEFGETFEQAVTREVGEEYATTPLAIQNIGIRNVLRGNPVTSHWIAILFAVRVDPETVKIGEPHKFNELGWFTFDTLPSPLHSQTLVGLELFRAWSAYAR